MISTRFCFFCGTGYSKETCWEGTVFECSICGVSFDAPAWIKVTNMTLEQAEAAFNSLPLTDKKAVFAAKRKKRKV